MNLANPPMVVDLSADAKFRVCARAMGLDPDDPWVGEYVNYEWEHSRHRFEQNCNGVQGKVALEFGCNYGATAIVLASLGARVTAVDVDKSCLALAKFNAARYGLRSRIDFQQTVDSSALPFESGSFDLVSCNSVLEYVPRKIRPRVHREIDRVLAMGGLIFVGGTSNRIWPKEQHSGRWGINYVPLALDDLLFARKMSRGVFPWRVTRGFGNYGNTDLEDGGASYFATQQRAGMGAGRLWLLRVAHRLLRPLRCSVGLLTPCISVTLRKEREQASPATGAAAAI